MTFDSLDPASGERVATFAVHGPDEVAATVDRARSAGDWWWRLGPVARSRILRRWRAELVGRAPELAALIHRENGKPIAEATVEITLAVAHLSWATSHASRVLRSRRVLPGMLAMNHTARVDYLPFGVVGVIGPWNYPVHTPMGSISYALAAGNAVVLKPSEYAPAVGSWLVESFASICAEPVLQLVTGFGETGAALCASGVDKLAFTGSARTARLVMAGCTQSLTPCVIEGGGKDSFIVAADADLARAAEQAVWGAMFNAGQTCAGVEVVYAEAAIYEQFLTRLTEAATRARTGPGAVADYGPMTMPAQVATVAGQVSDAIRRGATAVVGGVASIRAPWISPIVLADVDADAPVLTQETFGPVIVVQRVADLVEAVRRTNESPYALGASVFSRRHGDEVARQLGTGMVSINSVLSYASMPALPWGGSRESGFGRVHGREGLREFARPRAVTRQWFRPPIDVTRFARTPAGRASRSVDASVDGAIRRLSVLTRLRWGRAR
ncbi:MAG: putative aldehyde dehydrogenase [Frankiales bacterium]|nr:putative aldehyde dehydrogenase [Frankiales bacterium]